MAGKKLELGPIGDVVAKNVTRYREAARFNYTELSNELAKHQRDISPLGIRRVEEGNRRVDVDDLVAFALALNVSPLALLLPRTESSLVADGETFSAESIWRWAQGFAPLMDTQDTAAGLAFMMNSNPFADWAEWLKLPIDNAKQFNTAMRQALAEGTIAAEDIDLSGGNFRLNFKRGSTKGDDGES